ncbi:uncharacterized protein B0P05DRAFT_540822, partial [Gilbertella persicaria]|uniref:uncharacterized protein n=1 Tax=Gilbertella persicaria TaxID=101096 RepID=UPI0022205BAC
MPENTVKRRLDQLDQLVRHHCPSHHIDFYVFIVAILCVVCSAIFTFIARSLHISMWCPLLLLLIPTGLSFWTSKKRSTLGVRMKQFESLVNKTLYDFSSLDQHILWTMERMTMPQQAPFKSARFCLMIQIKHTDDQLPSYQEAMMTQPIRMPEPVALI